MAEKQNIPEIRFEGFTDPWEQRKLNEYLETSREKNESCHFGKDDVLSVSGDYGIVNQIEFQGRSYAGTSVANYGVVHKGDVVYTKSPLRINPYGIIKTNRGNDGIVSTLYAVYHPTEKTHPDFVQVYFEQNARMNNYMAPLVSKGAKNDMKVSAENALKGAVTFPGIEEQEVIASYFSQLDDLITLHQRKYDKLCTVKKSMLDKMFPKPGETEPEIRFEGFTDPWEQRKLGEVAHRVIRKNEGNQSDLPLTISAQHGLVDQRDYFNNQVASRDMSGYYLLENGEFAYNKSTSGDSPWGAIKRLTKYEKGCLSTLYICFGLDLGDPDFLVTYYETNRWHGAVQMIAAEGARNHGLLNIAPDDFFETVLTLPCSTEEQKQIGCFFTQLNSLITLHQRKCQYRSLYGYLSWEQRKLGGLFFESNERSSSMEILSVSVAKGIYPASESNRDTNPGASLANYKVVHKGDVVYNSMRMWQGAVGSSDYDGIVSPAYVVARPVIELDSTCFGYLLKRPEMLYKYLCDSQGNSKDTQTLKYNRFADIEVTMPVNLEEQRVISACLGRVDTLITLHQ